MSLMAELKRRNVVRVGIACVVIIGAPVIAPAIASALEKAVRHDRDPLNQNKHRVLKGAQDLQLPQVLRLNTEYREARPNNEAVQSQQHDLRQRHDHGAGHRGRQLTIADSRSSACRLADPSNLE